MSNSTLIRYWVAPMFTFGAIRGYRVEMPEKHQLVSDKLCNTFGNGVFYIIPPVGIMKLIHMADRMEVRATNRNPNDYPQIYWEGRGSNKNTFL
jgi:hypothetical protein